MMDGDRADCSWVLQNLNAHSLCNLFYISLLILVLKPQSSLLFEVQK